MIRATTTKRAMSVWLATVAAGGALLAATPSSAERTGPVRPAALREARVAAAAPRAVAPVQFKLLGNTHSVRPRADELEARRAPPKDEPVLEPWSLIAGGLSVMVFIARRRRSD